MSLFKRKTTDDDGAVTCPECGERVPEGAATCAMCGHVLEEQAPEPAPITDGR